MAVEKKALLFGQIFFAFFFYVILGYTKKNHI